MAVYAGKKIHNVVLLNSCTNITNTQKEIVDKGQKVHAYILYASSLVNNAYNMYRYIHA